MFIRKLSKLVMKKEEFINKFLKVFLLIVNKLLLLDFSYFYVDFN